MLNVTGFRNPPSWPWISWTCVRSEAWRRRRRCRVRLRGEALTQFPRTRGASTSWRTTKLPKMFRKCTFHFQFMFLVYCTCSLLNCYFWATVSSYLCTALQGCLGIETRFRSEIYFIIIFSCSWQFFVVVFWFFFYICQALVADSYLQGTGESLWTSVEMFCSSRGDRVLV